MIFLMFSDFYAHGLRNLAMSNEQAKFKVEKKRQTQITSIFPWLKLKGKHCLHI